MFKSRLLLSAAILVGVGVVLAQGAAKTRVAIVGLDHDHVWGLMKTVVSQPEAELVAIADSHPELIEKAKAQAPRGVKFYASYVEMLDAVKPDAVIVTTANNLHPEILQACAQRHIHFFTEKPLAATGAQARKMERTARAADIKLMVNYWNVWAAASQEAYSRIQAGELGPVQKLIVAYGHQGPKEIGVSRYFADWLYDPIKNGAGALMDFGCYGADWAVWLMGCPTAVYATSLELKSAQQNAVEDDAVILLQYAQATVVLLPSWNWPYGRDEVQVFGPKGSYSVRGDGLLFQPAGESTTLQNPEGQPIETKPLPPEKRNGVAYFLNCIQNDKPIEGPISAEMNVAVNEILDAALVSARTGKAVKLPAR